MGRRLRRWWRRRGSKLPDQVGGAEEASRPQKEPEDMEGARIGGGKENREENLGRIDKNKLKKLQKAKKKKKTAAEQQQSQSQRGGQGRGGGDESSGRGGGPPPGGGPPRGGGNLSSELGAIPKNPKTKGKNKNKPEAEWQKVDF